MTVLAQLSDRAGMMVSPKAAKAPARISAPSRSAPGPYKFVERVQNDRIVLEKFQDYWNKQGLHFDKITYLPIPDSTVRLANLRSGDLDMIERLAPTDVETAKADANLTRTSMPSASATRALNINVDNGDARQEPLGQDKRVRQALELSIDRDAINQVVFEGTVPPGNQSFPPASPLRQGYPDPPRDVDKAKALLKQAGVKTPFKFEVTMSNSPRLAADGAGHPVHGGGSRLRHQAEADRVRDHAERGTKAATSRRNQYGWSGRSIRTATSIASSPARAA